MDTRHLNDNISILRLNIRAKSKKISPGIIASLGVNEVKAKVKVKKNIFKFRRFFAFPQP